MDNFSVNQFLNIFGGYFNSDVINPDDESEVEDAIYICSSVCLRKSLDRHEIISYLKNVLSSWSGHTIAPFIDSTCLDWLWDDATEQILKHIVEGIIRELETAM